MILELSVSKMPIFVFLKKGINSYRRSKLILTTKLNITVQCRLFEELPNQLPDKPFRLNVSAGSYVVLCGEHKLVVEDPFGLVVETGGRVKLHNLVVLQNE